MGRKASENHNISENLTGNIAEELIQQQNVSKEFILGDEDQEEMQVQEEKKGIAELERKINMDQEENNTKEKQVEKIAGTVILIKAATYFDCGIRFIKNKPVKIFDQKVYEHLLKTELFIHL